MSNIQYPNHTPGISGGSINRAATVKTAKVFRATLFLFGSEDGKTHLCNLNILFTTHRSFLHDLGRKNAPVSASGTATKRSITQRLCHLT
jgi:hypothetical protein